MASLIESAARKAKGALTGVAGSESQSRAQDERGAKLIKQLATGGLAIGGGTGALVALANYLNTLKKEQEMEDESRLNDDTIYIPIGNEKSASTDEPDSVNRYLAPGLGVTGGILAAGGAYALTQKIYNYLEKKRRQKMLDEAQGEALAAADIEMGKEAADGDKVDMNLYDVLTSMPVAVPLLAALASGGVSYAALNKTFPVLKTPKSKYPKRIRQVTVDEDGEKKIEEFEDEEDVLKSASAGELRAREDCEHAANEFVMLMADAVAIEKNAKHSVTSDLLAKVASEGIKPLEDIFDASDFDGVVAASSGAGDYKTGHAEKVAAAHLINKSHRIGPVARTIAAAEFTDLVPGLSGIAFEQGPDQLDKMAGLASLLQCSLIRPLVGDLDMSKSAALVEDMSDHLTDDMVASLNSDVSGAMSEDAEDMNESDDFGLEDDDDVLGYEEEYEEEDNGEDTDIDNEKTDIVDDLLDL